MIERDLSHCRFLCTRVQKGEMLNTEDIDFLIKQRDYLHEVYLSIIETIEIIRLKEEEL